MGNWDKSLKTLVASDPQVFARWLLRERHMKTEGVRVLAQLDTHFQGYDLDADALLRVELAEREDALVHIEFQSTPDEAMPDRLLDYCRRARRKYGPLPILSSVIYLRDVGKVPEPPYCWSLKNGRKLMAFDYLSIKLHEEEANKIQAFKQPALLPLRLMTKGGASRTIVTEVFNELLERGLKDLLPATSLLASLAFQGNRANLDWLEREYRKMTIDFKDLPAYHWMTDDARKEGLEQGREQGLEQGREQGLRLALLSMIRISFPDVAGLAEKQLKLIQHAAPLEKLVVNVHQARTSEEITGYLSEALVESLKMD